MESDFYFEDVWRCANSEDAGESCFDVYREKMLTIKEERENE